jgi:hypothetical protein
MNDHTTTDHTPAGATAARSGRVTKLAAEAADAARVRALTTHPDVIALRVEKVRAQVDALLWAGIVLGLAFTMVNVQAFAAAGAGADTSAWWVAWLLDPMVSLVLLAVLRAEQVTARYQVALPTWARRTKWLTFAATYVMNTWTSWGLDGGPLSWSGVVLHSVPPLVVFATAETGPGLRDRLTESVHRALHEHTTTHATTLNTTPPVNAIETVHEPATTTVHEPVPLDTPPAVPPAPRRPARRPRKDKPAPRRLLADYLTDARTALDTARAAGEQVALSPAWCRQVTGCSTGTSVKVAAALRAPATPAPGGVPEPARSTSAHPSVLADRQEAA